MNKQERLHKIRQLNQKWFFQRLTLGIPAGLAVYMMLRSNANIWMGFAVIGLVLMVARHFFAGEMRFVKAMTENEQAKYVVALQYRLDLIFLIIIALVFPLTIRFVAGSWIPFVLFLGTGVYVLWTQEKLDRQLRQLDAEQPTRREIQRIRFSLKGE